MKTFAGIKLKPVTKQREVVAAEMGMKAGSVSGRYRENYFLRDTIILLWLCTLDEEPDENKPDEWSVDRCEEEPAIARKAAYKWADGLGLALCTKLFDEAKAVFVEMILEIKASRAEPIIVNETRSEDSGEL